ncbi:MAG TPA: choice-of-anchor D domain-containing protein, partial [Candidatus Cloacimonadota bacterium]|nr:choice-of-anchor D domain-containing protein [Candidatus Cloacimonadota bacterium]
MLITPPLDLGTNNYRLRFWLYGTTYAVTKLKVQIADNNALAGSFVTDLAEYTGGSTMPSGWTRKEIDLTGYEGVQYIAFRIVDQNGLSIYIDDIVIDEIPTTPIFAADPIEKDFAGIGMGQSSADQTFTITNTGIGTLVIDSATITGENAGQFVLTDSNTYPKSLLEDQSMTVKVKFLPTLEGNLAANLTFAYNDGTDQTANVALTGNGINPIIHNFPHVETFDTFPPLFWTRWTGLLGETSTLTSTTSGWLSNTWFANTTNHENGKATKLNNYGTSRYYWLITPTIDLGDNVPGGYKLEFDLALTEYYDPYPPELDGDDDKFAVIISTDNGETWSSLNALRLWDNAGSDYVYNEISLTGERITINLIGYSGEVKIGFYGESTIQNADNDIHLDNVTITYDATLPVELSAFNTAVLTNNTVSLSWTTQSENNLFGYHLHRSTEERLNSAERITSALISPTNTSNEANYTYVDSEVLPETTYYYWLQTVESNGTSQFFGPYSVRTNEGNIVPELPSFTSLQSVYPNPFTGNSHANFGIDVKEGETAQFVIYNIKGQVVKTYKNINPGKHNLVWDGKDNYKKNCAAGIYFYKLSSP